MNSDFSNKKLFTPDFETGPKYDSFGIGSLLASFYLSWTVSTPIMKAWL